MQKNALYYKNNYLAEFDAIVEECIKDGEKIKTDYEFDDSLTLLWGQMGEIEVKSTEDRKVVCASWEEQGYQFLICAISVEEEEDEIDPSTIGKEASYIIKAFE